MITDSYTEVSKTKQAPTQQNFCVVLYAATNTLHLTYFSYTQSFDWFQEITHQKFMLRTKCILEISEFTMHHKRRQIDVDKE